MYLLRKFIILFVGAFCICLFVLMMQFVWRYVDELIGKGLSLDILAKFFWYMALTLVPMALPLSILLTSLISFGNMGENLELTAMKSAGIPLIRIMAPLIIFCGILLGISFEFQNNISPNAQKQLTRLLVTMKETSPAIEIPEGVFYNGIPNVNLYVKHKEAKTGMLYDVIIYKMDQGFENAQIVVADSGRLETTADKHFLKLTIYSGEQFENLRSMNPEMARNINVPYDREVFKQKSILIDFDSNINLQDEDDFNTMASVKDLNELWHGADSITKATDSIGNNYYIQLKERYLYIGEMRKSDSLSVVKRAANEDFEPYEAYIALSLDRRFQVLKEAQRQAQRIKEELEWEEPITGYNHYTVRKHYIEINKKFALSLACLIFFFIGAPLGAIIRKGGLGMPTVIAVIIFIFYYIIDSTGMKMSRDDSIDIWQGMWASTIVLTPIGVWLTYKSNKDSAVFLASEYVRVIGYYLLGLRKKRNFVKKEVIIETPDYVTERENVLVLEKACSAYSKEAKLPAPPNYYKLFFKYDGADQLANIVDKMEGLLQRLAYSDNVYLLSVMNNYPNLFKNFHVSPFKNKKVNITLALLFPLGLIVAIRCWRFRIVLYRDLKQIAKVNQDMLLMLDKIITEQNNP